VSGAVPNKDFIIDPQQIDFTNVVADIDAIRQFNLQRDAMEQLTAIVYDDVESHICVGYRDVSQDEFWCSGHMPGMPLMPGVIMCEVAAQICSYHSKRHDLLGIEIVGFGGLDNVRFRGIVQPGDRFLMVCQMTQLRRGRMITNRFQGFVDETLACEGQLRGIPLPLDDLRTA